MILNACVKTKKMVDENICKNCKENCRHAGEPTTRERLDIMKVFDTAEIGGKKLAILVDDESMRAYEAVEIDGEWEIDFAYPCIGIDADDAAQNLDFEGAREAGYRFPEE